MKRILENGELSTDMNCAHKALRRIGGFDPVPDPLVGTGDERMSDGRLVLDGSVTNVSVALDAAIEQSKLDLNGLLPPSWVALPADEPVFVGQATGSREVVTGDDGLTVTVGGVIPEEAAKYAVRGDRAQFIAEKGQPDGYAPLDGDGRLPLIHYPPAAGIGTVTSFGFNIIFMETIPSVVTSGSAVMVSDWLVVEEIPGPNWLGNVSELARYEPPEFIDQPIPDALIANLDAAKITSGVFEPERLPIARGVGASHAPGAVPDPGPDTGAVDVTDYLARDMSYKVFGVDIPYQTRVPNPAISYTPTLGGSVLVTITSSLSGTSLFKGIVEGGGGAGSFQPYTGPFTILPPIEIEAYGAKVGYNNSNRVFLIIP